MMLDVKLNALALSDLPTHSRDTGYLSIDHIKQGFCTSPAWKDLWQNLEALLKTSGFKEFVNDGCFKEHVTDPAEQVKFTTQLELGILGILWCTDTQEAKAEFLYKLVNPKNNAVVAWTDKELKTVIDKLFYFSNELVTKN